MSRMGRLRRTLLHAGLDEPPVHGSSPAIKLNCEQSFRGDDGGGSGSGLDRSHNSMMQTTNRDVAIRNLSWYLNVRLASKLNQSQW